ncbi:hypothetical protein DTO96_102152 [Ephemeroptericola cinctiostellae]|uniref:Uncharacterized protein n=1 Tax=Ephemeroptericola cinctiostellae TaxID=2268024 RepID=A0A345DDG0_9BURK|nr:hypothetical protein [Ephemeroptericola cinctiostellae]AXF86398.1 hypothetical protein DTO96_102152 [Ephemeroptericola cinctiostellae]
MNQCKQLNINDIKIDGVMIAIDDGSATIEDYQGRENEAVPSASGDHSFKSKRVTPKLKFKRQTSGVYDPSQNTDNENHEISFRDSDTGRRGRVTRAVVGTGGTIGNGDSAEETWLLLSKIQWL